jgi:hypothetical protein
MQNLKPRDVSKELLTLRSLNSRMALSEKEMNHYISLEKGFQGEKIFDARLELLTNSLLTLHNLMLEVNNTFFQIDTLVISQFTLYPLEIKNYEGDYYIKDDKWYSTSNTLINNPLYQIKRSGPLFQRLIQDLGYNFSIDTAIIFVNPEFYLYHAPMNLPIIFPTQINRFLNKLNKSPAKLNSSHYKLAQQLKELHITNSPFSMLPPYSYEQLKKGITCAHCGSFDLAVNNHSLVCRYCGFIEKVSSGVLRSVEEFILLFPERKITTKAIMDWCQIIKSNKTICNILSRNYRSIGQGRTTYYTTE